MNSLPIENSNDYITAAEQPYRVMLVDDSAVIRGLLTKWLSEDPAIEIVASAANGQAALNMLERNDPEIIVLDIEMPVMDGLTALPHIIKAKPNVQILMSSTLTSKNAQISLKAMALGAADYVPKPTTNREVIRSQSFQEEIIEKIKTLASAKRKQLGIRPYKITGNNNTSLKSPLAVKAKPVNRPTTVRQSQVAPKIMGIGSSTGGPQALIKFISGLGDNVTLPILVTQHMPATFTKILAAHLSKVTGRICVEGEDGMPLVNGRIYVAPGDNHMLVENNNGTHCLRLNKAAAENFCRPAVDPMFRSLSEVFGAAALGVILTGMGHDGLLGSQAIFDQGGTVIAQDEASSVVWGMPGAVSGAGICNAVLPLDEMAAKVERLLRGGQR